MSLEQYSDFELYPSATVKDRAGNLYSGPAKLYIAAPGTDIHTVEPIDITVTAGVWPPYQRYGAIAGVWKAQIRAEGDTKGSSPVISFRIDESPFPAPEVPTP